MVAESGSLTRAAGRVGLTQSALSRQIQNLEGRLGAAVFERTTRSLALTPAGTFLLERARTMGAHLESTLRQFREEFVEAPREIRIGLSRSVALAHLPGLFHEYRRRAPQVALKVTHGDRAALLAGLVDGALDIAVCGDPGKLPAGCQIRHRMADVFALIAPMALTTELSGNRPPAPEWLRRQAWIKLSPEVATGSAIEAWLRRERMLGASSMAVDGFDMIVHLVSLGLGIGLVPQRALAGFPRRGKIARLPLSQPFQRELVVISRHSTKPPPPHVQQFVDSIHFS